MSACFGAKGRLVLCIATSGENPLKYTVTLSSIVPKAEIDVAFADHLTPAVTSPLFIPFVHLDAEMIAKPDDAKNDRT